MPCLTLSAVCASPAALASARMARPSSLLTASAMPARTSASAAPPKLRQVRVGAPQDSPIRAACSRQGHSDTATDGASATMCVASSQSSTSTWAWSGSDSSRTRDRPIWVLPRKTAWANRSSSYMYSWKR